MKNLKLFIAVLIAMTITPSTWAANGDTFTAQTAEGVNMNFEVISEALKTCQVSTRCIDATYTGAVTVPATATTMPTKVLIMCKSPFRLLCRVTPSPASVSMPSITAIK